MEGYWSSVRGEIKMKRYLLVGIAFVLLLTACSSLAFADKTALSDKYGVVTVFTAPTCTSWVTL